MQCDFEQSRVMIEAENCVVWNERGDEIKLKYNE